MINNGKFSIKDGEDTQEYDINSNKAFEELNNIIVSSVRGMLLQQDKFSIEAFEDSKTYLIKLKPKDMQMAKILANIELYFDKKALDIVKVKMIENEEDFTIISFKNKKINEAISSDIFSVN